MDHSAQDPVARCTGLLGSLLLFQDRIEIHRSHLICDLHELIFWSHPVVHSRIQIDLITDFGMTASLLLPSLFVIRYAGCSQPSGRPLHDAMLENVFMLSLIDNRTFHDLLHKLEAMITPGRSPESANPDALAIPTKHPV
jgi:hypothetical protein